MSSSLRVTVISALLVFAAAMPATSQDKPALPESYSATLVHSAGEKTMTQKLYVNGALMRSEIISEGKTHVVLLDKKAGVVRVLDDAAKTFSEYPYRGNPSNSSFVDFELVNDPKAKVEDLGSEPIAETSCRKFKVVTEHGSLLCWADKKTLMPVRMQSSDGKFQIDWKNVISGPVADSLFEIPSGFAKKD